MWRSVLHALPFKPPYKSNKVLSETKVEGQTPRPSKTSSQCFETYECNINRWREWPGVMNRRIYFSYEFLIQPFSAVTTLHRVRCALQQRVSSMVLTERVSFRAMREGFNGRVMSRVLRSVRSSDLASCDLFVGNFKKIKCTKQIPTLWKN